MRPVTAVVAFCEGAHDVEFLYRVLEYFFAFEKVNWTFKEYPAPLNIQLQNIVAKHFSENPAHGKLYDFLLPKYVLRRSEMLVLIFNTGGRDVVKLQRARNFLDRFLFQLKDAAAFPSNSDVREEPNEIVTRVLVLFLYDAEDVGFDEVRKTLYSVFSDVLADSFGEGGWIVQEANSASARAGNAAVYIWGDDEGYGTLEDLLLPIHEESDPQRFSAAKDCIDRLCGWDSAKIPQRAKQSKSIMCLLGQKTNPGSAHSVMIRQTKIMNDIAFASSPAVTAFSAFLQEFFGVEQSG